MSLDEKNNVLLELMQAASVVGNENEIIDDVIEKLNKYKNEKSLENKRELMLVLAIFGMRMSNRGDIDEAIKSSKRIKHLLNLRDQLDKDDE